MMWFLNWVPYALGHHMNPLFSTLANAPNGINMVNNTSVMFVGLLVSPITVLFGPAAALNTALTLALAGSATSMYFVTRRFTTWRPAAFVAGLVYGVGPYGVAQGASHLQLSFVVLPPIILLLVHDIAVRKEGSSVLRGVILGLLVTAQFFVSVEVLAMTAIFGVLLFAYIAVRGHRMIPAQFSSALRGYASTAGVAVVLLAYPVWYMERGPGHLTGYYSIPAPYHADLLSPLIPDSSFRVSVPSLLAMADKFAVTPGENSAYLGLTLLAALLVGSVWLRRRAEVQAGLLVGIVAFVCSLGPRLLITAAPGITSFGTSTGRIPLPWAWAAHFPLIRDILPSRFGLFVVMAAAFLLGFIVDRVHALTEKRTTSSWRAALAPIGIAVVALVPLIPSVPYVGIIPVPSSTYFASDLVRDLPPGQLALIYPYPTAQIPTAAYWQTEAAMRFVMPGGYFLVPQLSGGGLAGSTFALDTLSTTTGNALSALYLGQPPARTPALRAGIRNELAAWKVRSVVAVPPPGTEPSVVSFIDWMVGTPPVRAADAYVWHLPGAPRR